jgi:hypothetical protein
LTATPLIENGAGGAHDGRASLAPATLPPSGRAARPGATLKRSLSGLPRSNAIQPFLPVGTAPATGGSVAIAAMARQSDVSPRVI